jgi:hypothetical protein
MNNYTENLNSTVRAVLSELELNQHKLQSQKEAAAFTDHYAKEALIAALEKPAAISSVLFNQQSLVEKMYNCQAISSALLSSANEANSFTKAAVTNSAVAASTIQVAANAIVRLASDAGSIFSITNAAAFDSEINIQATSIYKSMNEVAANAETISQLAMDASVVCAEIPSAIIVDKAKVTDAHALDLLHLLTGQYNTTKEQQQAIINELNHAIDAEKKTKQQLEKIKAEHAVALDTYRASAKLLNLGLQVHVSEKKAAYTVNCHDYVNPFPATKKDISPAENYYIFLVKDSHKTGFVLSTAIECIARPSQFIKVSAKANGIKKEIAATGLLDSDGEAMKPEMLYTVFVMVQLEDAYKKQINNFDDYLTAPSAAFSLDPRLYTPIADKILSKRQQQLAALANDVLTAQLKADQLQEIVTALTLKYSAGQERLNSADANKTLVQANKNLSDQLVQNARDLKLNTHSTLNTATAAKAKTNDIARRMSSLINQLIHVSEMLTKLSTTLIRKKALNPLISDDLVTMASCADKDAGNAVALTLVALQSAFTALGTITETEAITMLEHTSANDLYTTLTVNKTSEKLPELSLATTLKNNYVRSVKDYKTAESHLNKISKQLNAGNGELNKGQVNLKALQAGLAAANAAALAS